MGEQVIKVVDDLAAKAGIVIDWTQDNAMPLVMETLEQFIALEIAQCITWIVICLLPILFCIFAWINFKKATKAEECWALVAMASAIASVFSFISICINIFELISWLVAPNVQLLKTLMYMLE